MDAPMSETESAVVGLAQAHLYPNYRQPPFVLVRGRGSELWDASGRRFLDMYAGIAVSTLGHGHPRLTAALAEQAAQLIHVSNYFYNEPNARLAAELCEMTGFARAFFCNSGTEANEAMLKLARRFFFARGETERFRVIAFSNSFHGRTLGSLAVTGQNKYRDGFGPLGGVTHVPFGDLAAVKAEMGSDVAAIITEPVQAEGGVLPAPAGFLQGLRDLADAHGALLLFDEVQTGVGRTGTFLACQGEGVKPDAVALAKALGAGVPIGAMLCTKQLEEALPPGSHGSTFGGNALASTAARTVLAVLREGLLAEVGPKGEHLGRALSALQTKHPSKIVDARGRGLLRAVELAPGIDPAGVLGKLRDQGVLLTLAGTAALRFTPPLVVTAAELDEAVAILDRVLSSL
jgi:acetylornithine/N-succinyldiaminopimelate aminotransferase